MLADEIQQFLHGDVVTDEATIRDYSHDYSIFKVIPEVVVFPKDVEDVKNIVAFVAKKKREGNVVSITARSAGTDMGGGPLNDSIILGFTKYFNHIKEIGTDYARVEPGVYFRDFEAAITPKGLLYPPFPASKDLCAMGGIVNNNSGGEKTLAYGKTEQYVEELRVVFADGEEHVLAPLAGNAFKAKLAEQGFEGDVYRKLYNLIESHYDEIQAARPLVSKNSAGYFLWNVWDKTTFDITKLFVGSQGTLGLLLEAKLKLVKAKPFHKLAVLFVNDIALLPAVVAETLKFHPESFESYDDKTLGIAMRFLPELVKTMKAGLITLMLRFFPEAGMIIRGGFRLPKLVLLVEMTSDDEREVEARMAKLPAALARFPIQVRIVKNNLEAKKYWTIREQSFALLHGHAMDKEAAAFIDDIIVRPEYLSEFLPKVNAILDRYKGKLVYTIAGHAGDGNFHIIPLMDIKDPAVREAIPSITDEVYRLVLRYHGSITAEHNDGLIRTPYLREMYGENICALFREVKNIFDPDDIFNPGKKVGGSLDYSMRHIKSLVHDSPSHPRPTRHP